MTLRTAAGWITACVVLASAPALLSAQDKEYPIRTFVAEKVGSQRTVEKKMMQILDRVQKKDGKVTQEQHLQNEVEFSATVTTLELDALGREKKIELTVSKLVLTPAKEKPQEIIKPGMVVVAEAKDGKTVYSAKGKEELPGPAMHLLPRVMSLETGPVNEHDLFAVKQAQKVKGAWQADKKQLVQMFKSADPKLEPDAVTGAATLAAVKNIGGKDYLDIVMDLTMKTKGGAPAPDIVPEILMLKVTHQILIPADYSTGVVEQKTEVNMKQLLKGKAGTELAGVELDGGSKETTTAKITYLKK